MNPQRERHMHEGGVHGESHGHGKPDVHVKSHKGGHTVHILHQDGAHEDGGTHHDAESVAEQVKHALGGSSSREQRPGEEEEGDDLGGFASA